jgi:hypothetical protein
MPINRIQYFSSSPANLLEKSIYSTQDYYIISFSDYLINNSLYLHLFKKTSEMTNVF